MPGAPHVEKHLTETAAVRDIVSGISNELTSPLGPYILMKHVLSVLCESIGIALQALFVFASIKGH